MSRGGAPTPAWDPEEAARLARVAYRYVARGFPPDADLAALDAPQDAALAAQAIGNFPAYEAALRALCRAALQEARRAA